MASMSSLMLFITYLLLLNILSNGLAFVNDENNEDSYNGADIARTWNSDEDMFEGKLIKQVRDPSLPEPQRSVRNRYPPCSRYGCGKREVHVRKDIVPYSLLAFKIRQLQRKRTWKQAEPPCSRYGCGKRKRNLKKDFKSTSVIKEEPGSKMPATNIKEVVSKKENLSMKRGK